MFCRHCGNELNEDSAFCDKCGKAVNNKGTSDGKSASSKRTMWIIIAIVAIVIAIVAVVSSLVIANRFVEDAKEVVEKIEDGSSGESASSSDVSSEKEYSSTEEKTASSNSISSLNVNSLERRLFLEEKADESSYDSLTPNVPAISVDKDLSNVINKSDFEWYDDDFKDKLVQNQFVVTDGGASEFFEIYEMNRYMQRPSFITVDSMMHTYHLYFAYLLKSIEKGSLSDDLNSISEDMLAASIQQFDELRGTDWEEAAGRNVAFFAVGSKLLGQNPDYPEEVTDIVDGELKLIMAAGGPEISPLLKIYEDYSQYQPRGYYEGDEQLEKYFRAMMWYGRIQFTQKEEDMDKSALLMTLALNDTCSDKWESIYTVTSFFAGASDDLGYYDYLPAIQAVYGNDVKLSEVASDAGKWEQFHNTTAGMKQPRINSIPIEDGDDNVILGYRFMGQRFSIDATIMQELIYSRVEADSYGRQRMLPDVLDTPAALGSKKAYEILEDAGETGYKNFNENLKKMQDEFNKDDASLWSASLYAGWLDTLRPLLVEKSEGYPTFMQSDKWTRKTLETFAGSYTELKHDTVLYSKQVMAEMGGGWEDEIDDRGYVEPEPRVFARFAALSNNTAKGLKEYGYLSSADEANLTNLANLAKQLEAIRVKELNDELLTDEEYDLIRDYGGQLEHLWIEIMKAQTGEEFPMSDEYPAALVVDIATDPNGSVLEVATGNPGTIYVVVAVDGKIRICEGAVYSFYEFEQPINDRLTDSKWRRMLGIEIENYEDPMKDVVHVDHPDWVMDYRYVYEYEY